MKLKPGDEVRIDSNFRGAVEHIATKETDAYALEAVPNIPWSSESGKQHVCVGGQGIPSGPSGGQIPGTMIVGIAWVWLI